MKKFEEQLTSDKVIDSIRSDLHDTNKRGITRFPSLAISVEGKKGSLILTGNRLYEAVLASIQGLSEKVNP